MYAVIISHRAEFEFSDYNLEIVIINIFSLSLIQRDEQSTWCCVIYTSLISYFNTSSINEHFTLGKGKEARNLSISLFLFHIQHITKSLDCFLKSLQSINPLFCLQPLPFVWTTEGVPLTWSHHQLPALLSVTLKDNYKTVPWRQLTPRSPFACPYNFFFFFWLPLFLLALNFSA